MRPLPLLTLTRGTARSFAQAGARLRTHSVAGVAMAAVLALGVTGSLAMGQASAMSGNNCSPTISKQFFGKAIEPYTGKLTPVFRYTLTNCRGMQVKIITYGATPQSITVPGRNGQQGRRRPRLQDAAGLRQRSTARRRRPRVARTSARPSAATATGSPRARSSWSRATAADLHAADQQQRQQPARRLRRLRQPRLVGAHRQRSGTRLAWRMTLVSPDGDEGSTFEPSCNCTGYPGKLTADRHLHPEQRQPARHPLPRARSRARTP